MRLALNLTTRTIVDPDDLVTPINSIKVRRGEIIPFDVQLVQDGEPINLSGGTVSAYITDEETFATLIASETGIAAINSGDETIYQGELDLDETAVDALFASGTTKSAPATLELRAVTSALSYRSEPVELVIQNSYTPA
jgi:hypothetical protein